MVHNEKDTLLGTETDKECEMGKREGGGELIKHKNQINKTINNSAYTYVGPRSRVWARKTLCSAPHQHERKFSAAHA